MVEKSELYAREEQMAAKAEGPSCTPSQMARDVLGLKDVTGLTIVDLASGSSPLVAELIDEGANAHGVDMVYAKSEEEFIEAARKLLSDMANSAPYGYGVKMHEYGEAALEKFRASYQTHRDNYHTGFLTRLPLPDNFADITTSLNGITALADDVDLTMERVHEALRITKSGGKVVLAPLHTPYDPYFDYYASEHEEIIERLEAEGYKVEIEAGIQINSDLLLPEFTRMTIVKPGI